MSSAASIVLGERARAAVLAAAAATPFLVGRLASARNPDGVGGLVITCPFRATTGLPCPLCGSTRAVTLAVHGDGGFVEYNVVIVVLLALLALYGVVRAVAPRSAWPVMTRGERAIRSRPLRFLLAVGAVAWVWTLSHRETIVA